MDVRTVQVPFRAMAAGVALLVAAALAGCGSGPQPATGDPTSAPPSSTASASPTAAASGPATSSSVTTGPLPRACSLVPPAELAAATGLRFTTPAPTEGEHRSVCAFAPSSDATGLSVGVEPAARFAAKADASQQSVGVPGVAVAGLGEQALFFYSDADLPGGVGGVLVRSGGATIDVTLQGVGDETRTRDASVAVARVAIGRL